MNAAPSNSGPQSAAAPDLTQMIACPTCDLLCRIADVSVGQTARCPRCRTTLLTPRDQAMTRIVMLASAATVLMAAAVFFPFLELETRGFRSKSSVLDTVLAFSHGLMVPLAVAVAALIVVLPLIRLLAIVYTLAPMSLGYYPARHAALAFRIAQSLKPWAMAEIFVVGVAVALVKVAGLAQLTIGPAFWAFVALVVVTVLNDNFMCRLSVWKTLEERSQR